jgi:acyl-coenzyme A thioesterase PaaI-like protein
VVREGRGPTRLARLPAGPAARQCAFLDAALGSVVWRAIDRRCVTLKLTVEYQTPARVGDWLVATGEMLGHDEQVAQVRGRLYGPRHDVLAGLGDFALLRAGRPLKTRS